MSARAFVVPSMGKGSWTFKKSDVTRAIEAARKAKLDIARVEVSKEGNIVIIARAGNGAAAPEENDWGVIYE